MVDPRKTTAKARRATLQGRNAEYVIRSSSVEPLEGEWGGGRVVILRFPNRDEALAWFNSDEYREIAELRRQASDGEILLVEE